MVLKIFRKEIEYEKIIFLLISLPVTPVNNEVDNRWKDATSRPRGPDLEQSNFLVNFSTQGYFEVGD